MQLAQTIDIRLEGLRKLGANFQVENGYVIGEVKNNLKAIISLSLFQVLVQLKILYGCINCKGKTAIENAARERN